MGSRRRVKQEPGYSPPEHRDAADLAVETFKEVEFKLWRGETLTAEDLAEVKAALDHFLDELSALTQKLECDSCTKEAEHKFCSAHLDEHVEEAKKVP